METLLDHHLATFDRWLQPHFISLRASTRSWRYYLTVITLLDQLDQKEYNWKPLSVILQHEFPFTSDKALDLFQDTTTIEFSRIMSKFLMDRQRAKSFWVNSQKYGDLARHILEFVCDK